LFAALGCQGTTKGSADTPDPQTEEKRSPRPNEKVDFDVAPELVSMDPPTYPAKAKDAGVEGIVLVRVLVGADGLAKDVHILQSIPLLDPSAADAAWTAVFKPALYMGEPVALWMVIPIEFNLHGKSKSDG
jgi:protein TonB